MTQNGDRDAELERLARRVGAQAAERLDVERTAAAVVARLRGERAARRPRWIRPAWVRIAAVLVLMAGLVLLLRGRTAESVPEAQFVGAELQELTTDQLREVLATLDRTLENGTPELADENFDDLTTEQLQALLRSLEG